MSTHLIGTDRPSFLEPTQRLATPLERTLQALAGPYRPLVVWGLFWGARPFSDLMRHVPEISKRPCAGSSPTWSGSVSCAARCALARTGGPSTL